MKLSVVIPLGEKRSSEVLDTIKKQEVKVKAIIEIGPNPSANRNRGAKKAGTDLIAFVNGHTILPAWWSRKVIEFFKDHQKIDIAGGPQLTPKNAGYFEKVSGYALSSKFGSGGVSTRYSGKKMIFDADETSLTSANMACRKKVLKKIKFDENLYPGEDPKFISDAKRFGFKVAYSPELFVYHRRRANVIDFFVQNFKYGQMRPKKESFAETLKHPFFLAPSFFLIYLVLLFPLMLISSLFIIPLAMYLIFNVFFSTYEAMGNNHFLSFFLLPSIFLLVHISYGAGFLYGHFKKWKK